MYISLLNWYVERSLIGRPTVNMCDIFLCLVSHRGVKSQHIDREIKSSFGILIRHLAYVYIIM